MPDAETQGHSSGGGPSRLSQDPSGPRGRTAAGGKTLPPQARRPPPGAPIPSPGSRLPGACATRLRGAAEARPSGRPPVPPRLLRVRPRLRRLQVSARRGLSRPGRGERGRRAGARDPGARRGGRGDAREGAGGRRGGGGPRRARGLTWRRCSGRDPRGPQGWHQALAEVRCFRAAARPACLGSPASPLARGGSERGLLGRDPRRSAGGS